MHINTEFIWHKIWEYTHTYIHTHTHTHTHIPEYRHRCTLNCKNMQTYCRHIYILPQLTKHIFALTECSLWETNKPYNLASFMGIRINGLQGERCACVCVCVWVVEIRGRPYAEVSGGGFCVPVLASPCMDLRCECVYVYICACMYACVGPWSADHRRQAPQGPLTKHRPMSCSHNSRTSAAEQSVLAGKTRTVSFAVIVSSDLHDLLS